jgi:hypothetical protein
VNLTFEILLGFQEGERTVAQHRDQLLLEQLLSFALRRGLLLWVNGSRD